LRFPQADQFCQEGNAANPHSRHLDVDTEAHVDGLAMGDMRWRAAHTQSEPHSADMGA
jgi:hypothetical protein